MDLKKLIFSFCHVRLQLWPSTSLVCLRETETVVKVRRAWWQAFPSDSCGFRALLFFDIFATIGYFSCNLIMSAAHSLCQKRSAPRAAAVPARRYRPMCCHQLFQRYAFSNWCSRYGRSTRPHWHYQGKGYYWSYPSALSTFFRNARVERSTLVARTNTTIAWPSNGSNCIRHRPFLMLLLQPHDS